jgi:Tol biopolymer transport system component/DNA-binding winged helix-turn-helix (wHTH) protein
MTSPAENSRTYEFAPFRLDSTERLLLRDGQVVPLTPKAFDLLVYLVERHGRLVEKQALISALWPDTIVEETNLAYTVSALRKVLDSGSQGASLIQTVPTKGYRFVGLVTPTIREPARVRREPVWPSRRRWLLAGAGAVLVGAVWVVAAWTPWRQALSVKPESAAPHLVRLTTLPGMATSPALSPDGEQVVFAWRKPSGGASNLYAMLVGSPEVRQLTSGDRGDWNPAWSPDGRQIAFLRWTGTPAQVTNNPTAQIHVVSAIGGEARRISDYPALGRLAWSPDQRFILAGRNPDADGPRGIYAVPIDGSAPRPVISSVAPNGVFSPALVPDGRRMAYASCRKVSAYLPANCDAIVVDLDSDLRPTSAPRQLARMRQLSHLDWTRDQQAVVFAGDATGAGVTRLFRAAVAGTASIDAVDSAGVRVDEPATTRGKDRLVFTRIDLDVDVFAAHTGGTPPGPVVSSAGNDTEVRYSSSGRQVVFISDRTDHQEVWIAAADGSSPRQLTHGPNPEQRSPQWSPDDQRVAFQSRAQDGYWHIWIIDADGGPARQLTFSNGNQTAPTWSRDGRWIYFSDDRASGFAAATYSLDIWRVSANGGQITPITTTGSGFAAFESADGRSILYQQAPSSGPLMLLSLAGGRPRQVLACAEVNKFTWAPGGIFYLPCNAPHDAPVHRLDPVTGRDRVVATLERLDWGSQTGLAVSPDGSTFLYARTVNEDRGASLWVIENFR